MSVRDVSAVKWIANDIYDKTCTGAGIIMQEPLPVQPSLLRIKYCF